MKKLKYMILIGVALLATVTHAQTNSAVDTHVDAAMSSAPKSPLLTDVKQVAVDAWAALKDANFKNGVTIEPFGLYHNGDFGGGLAVSTASTNGVNVGFALATIRDSANKRFDFYDATLNIQLGKQVTIPIINLPAFLYVEAGPALNLAHINTILEQSVAGAKVFFDKGKLSIGAGIGQNSEWTEPFYVAHFSYTF